LREIDHLTALMSRLPGLGPRSAKRAVLHLIKKRDGALRPLIDALAKVADAITPCHVCGNIDTTDPCGICREAASGSGRRDPTLVCVVEDVADLWALERAGTWRGVYHVLGGRLSALEGIRPEDLAIEGLVRRVQDGTIREVVLALNATLEGQTTAHVLADRLAPFGVALTQLAYGVPVGGELDYLDEGTLTQALKARRPL
jgi:recombination protein RecR